MKEYLLKAKEYWDATDKDVKLSLGASAVASILVHPVVGMLVGAGLYAYLKGYIKF